MSRTLKICVLLLACCTTLHAQQQDAFSLPDIPKTITVPLQRAEYLLHHYWDACDFADNSLFTEENTALEQRFVDFLSVFPHADKSALPSSVNKLMSSASKNKTAYKRIFDLAEKYLYEPESPLSDEEHYLLFLDEVIKGKTYCEIEKTRLHFQQKEASKNRLGTEAADFIFSTADGKTTTLHESAADRQTMLLFYDADCAHCDEVILHIQNDTQLTKDITAGKLTVIAVCVAGTQEHWLAHMSNMPKNWTIGYAEPQFAGKTLYSIRTFPTIYLLDKNHKVIRKNWQF